jgi:uncharacterized protein (DUF302 family)
MKPLFSPVRSLLLAAVMLALTLVPGFAMAQENSEQAQLVQVVESTKSFAETLKRFKEEVSKAGWSVLNANNMAGVLSERGYTVHPVVILDVCSGKYSARILEQDAYRPVSAFMPCRVSIYQTSDGKVYLARMNTGAFAAMMPPEVAEVMTASDEEIDKVIANTVK